MKKRIETDVVIIGGGPAGCAAALSAKKSGVENVTIVEANPVDRHRIGEILLTNTIQDLAKLGIADDLYPYFEKYGWNRKFAAAYVHGIDRTPWQVVNNHPGIDINEEDGARHPKQYIDPETGVWFTLVVRRHEFDFALREICKSRGINIIHGKVTNCKMMDTDHATHSTIVSLDVLDLEGNTLKITPAFAIDATGQNAFMGSIRKNRTQFGDERLQSRYTYFTDIDFSKAIEKGFYKEGANILSYDSGWSWIAYLGQGQTSVGIVSRNWNGGKNEFWEKLKTLPEYDLFGLGDAKVVSYKNEPAEQDSYYVHKNYRLQTPDFSGTNWA